MVQILLQTAAEKAPMAREFEHRLVKEKEIGKCANGLQRAFEQGSLAGETMQDIAETLGPLAEEIIRMRITALPPDSVEPVVHLAPGLAVPFEILHDDGLTTIVRGPFGVGGGPSRPEIRAQQLGCIGCGSHYFDGRRCVVCGMQNDFDW